MVGRGLRPRKTHDLEQLVAEMGVSAPEELLVALRSLAMLAWTTRYPDWEEPGDEDIEQYVAEHKRVVAWLEELA